MSCQRVMLQKGMCSLMIVHMLRSDVRMCVTHVVVNSYNKPSCSDSTYEPQHQVMAIHGLTWVFSTTLLLILTIHVSTKMKLSLISNRMGVGLISSA